MVGRNMAWGSSRFQNGIALHVVLLIGALLANLPVDAQAQAASGKASQPTAVSIGKAPISTASSPANDCPARPDVGVAPSANILVTLDPTTLWRPRGSEVQFLVSGKDGGTIQVQRVQVCFGWSAPPRAGGAHSVSHSLQPSPLVRSIASGGSTATFGAVVPDLTAIPSAWPWRLFGGNDVSFTAIFTVPLADMVVAVTLPDKTTAVVLMPVGVTSVTYAMALVLICVADFFFVAWLFVRRSRIPGNNLVLKMICAQDGGASLSQFQILLWTVTIGASAVYVMVLSGNLINLTDGALILLGIAGGATLLARVPSGALRGASKAGPALQNPPRTEPPLWSDLVVVDGVIDITRVQMLVFTLISAAFVILKVLVGYIIPDIPANFLLLMGISNGIYVVGRRLPNQET